MPLSPKRTDQTPDNGVFLVYQFPFFDNARRVLKRLGETYDSSIITGLNYVRPASADIHLVAVSIEEPTPELVTRIEKILHDYNGSPSALSCKDLLEIPASLRLIGMADTMIDHLPGGKL